MDIDDCLSRLKALGSPEVVERKARKFGISSQSALGIYQKDLNVLAKEIGPNEQLALQLIETGIYDALMLAAKIFPPRSLNSDLMDD